MLNIKKPCPVVLYDPLVSQKPYFTGVVVLRSAIDTGGEYTAIQSFTFGTFE